MEEKTNVKSIFYVVAIVVVIAILAGAYFLIKNNTGSVKDVDKIVIKENESDEEKIAKLQKKIELLNERINKIQEEINPELEKINDLYEEYVNAMNAGQQVQTSIQEIGEEEESIEGEETEEIVNNGDE